MVKMRKRYLGRSVGRQQNMSEETARKVDSEIRKFVDMGYDRARKVLTEKLMIFIN